MKNINFIKEVCLKLSREKFRSFVKLIDYRNLQQWLFYGQFYYLYFSEKLFTLIKINMFMRVIFL